MCTREPPADSVLDRSQSPDVVGCPPRSPWFVDREGVSILVRPFGEADYAALLTFYEEYPQHHRSMSLPPLTTPQIESWLGRLIERGRNIVAYDDDELVGHVAYSPQSEPEAELVVFVAETYHDRGIGTELCRQAIAYAARDGHETLKLFVDRNNERAIHVYESLGFRTVSAEGKETVEMRLDLTASVASEVQTTRAESD